VNKDAGIIGIYGGRGMGKSTYAKKAIKKRDRVVIFDVMDEYHREMKREVKYADSLHTISKIMQQCNGDNFKIGYVPNAQIPADQALHELSMFLMKVQQPYKDGKSKKKLTLLVEELSKSAPNEKQMKGQRGFQEIIDRGRHYGIEIIGTSQRVKAISMDFRTNSAEEIFFSIFDQSEVSHIEAKLPPQWRDKIMTLPPHHYIKVAGRDIFEGKNEL
jgi:AAA+ ATPase superfamily predicted ATPase